ncbi:TLD-domain-containing protein [Neocallimastix lanati (nom. inval.)]|uniref:TLD-domain-containing protein n=1 Tax=Neocallimastix californiae TaxID=1754190 RepID=A0A1Y2DI68_9FUNG|nr:TLD-domain-containing protein [Neocallimastix sp. JGI-2020a]ORY58941.1 TLD-domain-containing protein [Neocallimastix californiae]|eukprot:ORY58941.1 TLD-domain-containing protein [Neocallimastix californiae]
MRSIIKPLNDVSILSNNNIATIEIKTPLPKENSSDLFKAFLKGDYDPSKGDENTNTKPLKKEEEVEEDSEFFENRNKLEKFKTSESSTSLNVLLESINIKCSAESLSRNDSLESLESVDFDNTKKDPRENDNDNSWISNISKSFQSWLNQKNDYDLNYFTRTDKDGNIQILSVSSIMQLYGIDFDQAINIHEYVTAKIPKFPQNITGYTKYIEKLNSKNASPKETRILELVHRHRGLKPIISGDLARQLQNQLPDNLRSKRKWTMQFSLNSLDNNSDSSKDILNLSQLLYASNNHGPCLIIIQDDNNYVFGAFINEELRNDINNCYGTKECFIWKYQNSNLEIFRPVEECNDLIYSNAEFLSIGGNNDGQFALYLDKRLKNGHSYRNKTFKSKILSSFNDFYISELELWTFN